MKCLVTGAAGFIGSHLCERLLRDERHEVVGVDGFVASGTPRWIKERNLQHVTGHPKFSFVEQDLAGADWDRLLPGVDIVYHLAAIPGVRSSWGASFASYVTHNILVTQRLLEACKAYPVQKIVYASTSSVYGEKTGAVNETASTMPLSPYGVSKLTGEHLCRVYHVSDGLPVVILRFFTVYGPRQRPDMAFHRFIRQIFQGKPVQVYGSGKQTRDFTFIDDCVEAIAATAYAEHIIGETINIGGKERASVLDCVSILEELFAKKIAVEFAGSSFGEPTHTWADIGKAQRLLGYRPKVDLRRGLMREIRDLQLLYGYETLLPRGRSVSG
jgi:nucleoside-diphosphate-sugar epimerase